MESINSEINTCHICMTATGLYEYKAHGDCQYTEKVCKPCAKKLMNGKFKCPVCRVAACKDIFEYDPEAHLLIVFDRVVSFLNFVYCEAFPIAEPFKRRISPTGMYTVDICRRVVKPGFQPQSFLIIQDCLLKRAECIVHILFMYQEFPEVKKGSQDARYSNIPDLWTSRAFTYIDNIRQVPHHLDDIGEQSLINLQQEVKDDPERETDPVKYRVLDMMVELYTLDDTHIDCVPLTEFLFKMLSDAKAFREAKLMWSYYTDVDHLVLERCE